MSPRPVLLRAAGRAWVPWRNGGGLTSLVAVDDVGRSTDWDWRVSVARVDEAGPFSRFAGIDRVLTVLSGTLELTGGDGATTLLGAGQAARFAGEAPIVGRPLGGRVVDLNVMARRGRYAAGVERLAPLVGGRLTIPAAITLLFFERAGRVEAGGERFDLAPHDALLIRDARGLVALSARD